MRGLSFSVLRRCRSRLWCPASRALCSQPKPVASTLPVADPKLIEVHSTWPPDEQPELRAATVQGMQVLPDFVSEAEEGMLLAELEPMLKRIRYEYDHWDNAIIGFRETERRAWSPSNEAVISRIRSVFPRSGADSELLPAAHVLDLAAAGYIKPHIDAVRFCGGMIAGLCLLSDAVMRLQHETHKHLGLDALLQRRALYIMSGVSRYSYTHAVLGGEESAWRGERLQRRRRVALILRSQPRPDRN
ncbi:alpha-ketoglutarate-dependent dioxygenase alkB homolog 7, mitochondrial [Leguminivora glycinivorella]|uniref:alpha-ketoglutarate-dependent dioxygenase alkB homolog 7, mitochondrial n=1 Tax=Leguminivora glycinivorella TaxID=1035111 RepID=UPI00200C596B|nr:alpha-ketoglutarate-dependent dioxygenase alkB homolog 7, mitochondrial [Leguminivora glycinivorella]